MYEKQKNKLFYNVIPDSNKNQKCISNDWETITLNLQKLWFVTIMQLKNIYIKVVYFNVFSSFK